MLAPLLLTCYFRLRAGLSGKGEKTLIDEIRVLGSTFFIMCCIDFFIDWLFEIFK